jgi:hypothetical protein
VHLAVWLPYRPRHCGTGVPDSEAHLLEDVDISALSESDTDKDTDDFTDTNFTQWTCSKNS